MKAKGFAEATTPERAELVAWENALDFQLTSVEAWPQGARGALTLSRWLATEAKENLKPTSFTSWTVRWVMGVPLAAWGNLEDVRWLRFRHEDGSTDARFLVHYRRMDWTKDQLRDSSKPAYMAPEGYYFHDRLSAGHLDIRPPTSRRTRLVFTTLLLAAAHLCSEDMSAGFSGKTTPTDIVWPRWQACIEKCVRANCHIAAWLEHCRQKGQYNAACCVMEKAITFIWRWAASHVDDQRPPGEDKNLAHVWRILLERCKTDRHCTDGLFDVIRDTLGDDDTGSIEPPAASDTAQPAAESGPCITDCCRWLGDLPIFQEGRVNGRTRALIRPCPFQADRLAWATFKNGEWTYRWTP